MRDLIALSMLVLGCVALGVAHSQRSSTGLAGVVRILAGIVVGACAAVVIVSLATDVIPDDEEDVLLAVTLVMAGAAAAAGLLWRRLRSTADR